jgi:ABC-type uncharacterized transport system substrate-binding protein
MMRCTLGFLVTLALLICVAPLAVEAHPAAKIPSVGVLKPGRPLTVMPRGCLQAFQQGPNDLGYREGQSIILEYRYGEFQPARLPALATDLVHRQPDVLWTHSAPAARAVK